MRIKTLKDVGGKLYFVNYLVKYYNVWYRSMKKILIIHGLMNLTTLYNDIKETLSTNYDVDIFPIYGLDYNKNRITSINKIVNDLDKIIKNYDIIIAHSMGANIVLRLKEVPRYIKIMLLNPHIAQLGIIKRTILSLLSPIYLLIIGIKALPSNLSYHILKICEYTDNMKR